MIAAGILLILGAVMDILIHSFSVIHAILVVSGLLLIVINSIGGKKFISGKMGKLVLSTAALALTCLFLAGFFPSLSTGVASSVASDIKKAEQIAESKSAQEAAKFIDEKITQSAWNRDLLFTSAELFRKYGQFSDAAGRYHAILSKSPFDIEARYSLALCFIGQKNYNQAIDKLKDIILYDPLNADAISLLGDCYWANGNSIHGIYYYKMSVKLAADSVEKRVKLAQAYADMHSDEEAMIEYRKAKDLAKTFEEKMMVYNGYSSIKSEASSSDEAQQREAEQ